MSCLSCCAFDVPQIGDFAAGGYYIYPLQDYSFVITTCPVGLACLPGILPQTVNIGRKRIPVVPVPPNPTLLTLQGCQSLITATVPPGASTTVIAGIAAGMQQQFAQQQANCDVATKFNFPTLNTRVDVFNTAQTASCVSPQFGDSVTVAAGTVGVTLFNPTTADVATAQASVNTLALLQAQAQLLCFNPGPDWRQLVWDTYTIVQCAGIPPQTVVSGKGLGAVTTGNMNKDAGSPCIGQITPVHASMNYTGPSVICTLKRVITNGLGLGITAPSVRVKNNGVSLTLTPSPGNPVFPAPGTYFSTFTMPLSNNALVEVDDIGGGNSWATVGGAGQDIYNFTTTFYQ